MGWGQICFDQIQCSKNLNSGEVSISHVFFTLGTRAGSNVGKLVSICVLKVLPILHEQKAERPISRLMPLFLVLLKEAQEKRRTDNFYKIASSGWGVTLIFHLISCL